MHLNIGWIWGDLRCQKSLRISSGMPFLELFHDDLHPNVAFIDGISGHWVAQELAGDQSGLIQQQRSLSSKNLSWGLWCRKGTTEKKHPEFYHSKLQVTMVTSNTFWLGFKSLGLRGHWESSLPASKKVADWDSWAVGRHGCSRITLNIQHFRLSLIKTELNRMLLDFSRTVLKSEILRRNLRIHWLKPFWQLRIVAYHSIISPDKMDTTGFQEVIFNVNCDFADHLLKTSCVHRALVRSSGLEIHRKVWSSQLRRTCFRGTTVSASLMELTNSNWWLCDVGAYSRTLYCTLQRRTIRETHPNRPCVALWSSMNPTPK